MIYRGGKAIYGNIGLATSKDGVGWQRQSKKPILTSRVINEQGIFVTNYFRQDRRDCVWFEAGWIDNVRVHLLTRP